MAGTSAGAAIMSRIMFRDARNVLETLTRGVTMGKEISRGLGFLDPSWFVEQHSLNRGRFARSLAAMQSQGFKYGVGVAENTALVVTDQSHLKVIGEQGAVVLDLSQSSVDPNVKGFNLKNARLTYLDHGDELNLSTLALTPGPEKKDESKIDPNSADFHPEYDDRIVTNDILGNNTVCDLINRLMINKTGEAIGLAFDGAAAMNQPTPGFEFHFYRGQDTVRLADGGLRGPRISPWPMSIWMCDPWKSPARCTSKRRRCSATPLGVASSPQVQRLLPDRRRVGRTAAFLSCQVHFE